MPRKLAAGNWKMNGCADALGELETLAQAHGDSNIDILICPPATLISRANAASGTINIGGQDCHANQNGAHTGDISAEMLADAGATHVILGHSERRQDHGESDATVQAKTNAALAAGLTAVVCLGESLQEREAGDTLGVIGTQLAGSLPDDIDPMRTVIAYEPIWAIGTGKVPTLDEIAGVHNDLRARLTDRFGSETANQIPLLYGGSVKPGNAADIFATFNVDGALVGGASLKAADFTQIIAALEQA